MRVEVINNNVERAMRVLGKKLKEEGFWDEHKRHRHFTSKSQLNREKRANKKLG